MTDVFKMRLKKIQPSQLFISSKKLSHVMRKFDFSKPETLQPIPVKKLGNEVIITDGHSRALAAYLCGLSEVSVFWDEDELDLEAYKICVEWCKQEGIHTIADLGERVVDQKDYKLLWLKRCKKMFQNLEAKRRKRIEGKVDL